MVIQTAGENGKNDKLLIENVPQIEFTWMAVKNTFLAEAYFIIAYAYSIMTSGTYHRGKTVQRVKIYNLSKYPEQFRAR